MSSYPGFFRRIFHSQRWFEWLHNTYIVLALAGIILAIFQIPETAKELVLLSIIGIYLLVIFVGFVGTSYSMGRKSRYAEANKSIHEAIHAARDAYHYLEWCLDPDKDVKLDKSHFADKIQSCLTATSKAFTLVTSTNCRACIKLVGLPAKDKESSKADPEKLFVQTLARDSVSKAKCEDKDRTESNKHFLLKNTDFKFLFERRFDYFFSNNLTKIDNYENTSLPDGFNDGLKSGADWKLNYKSTIVWPIRYVFRKEEIKTEDESDNLKLQDLYGFLAIDSDSRNIFNERYDVEMGAIVADALFPVLSAYRDAKGKSY